MTKNPLPGRQRQSGVSEDLDSGGQGPRGHEAGGGRRLCGCIWKLGEIPKLATDRGYNQAEMEKYDKLKPKKYPKKK